MKGVAQRSMRQNTSSVVGIFLLGQLLSRFYCPPFLPQKLIFGVRPAICFNMGRDGKHPLMFKIDIGKLHSEQEMWVWENQKWGHILPLSHWSRGTAWHSAKITKNMAKMQ